MKIDAALPGINEENSNQPPPRSSIMRDYYNLAGHPPLLSILCITYNHVNYIAQALDSFLMQQTNFPIEIVIGEDSSKDGTLSIIENYKNKYPSIIKIITSESNVGFVENFRRTLNQCKGKYIAICEGDDYWIDEQKIQIQVDFLEKNPEYVITYHDASSFDESGRSTIPQLMNEFQRDASQDDLIRGRPISTLTTCFRNIISDIPREFDDTPILDLCLWSLLGNFGKGKYLSNIKPAAYRIHEGGIFSTQSTDEKKRMTMHAFLCLSRYYERAENKPISEYYTFQITLLACSQISSIQKIRLIATQVDSLLGSPLYFFKKLFIQTN